MVATVDAPLPAIRRNSASLAGLGNTFVLVSVPQDRSGKKPQRGVQDCPSIKCLVAQFGVLACSGRVACSDSQYLSLVCYCFHKARSAVRWEAMLLD